VLGKGVHDEVDRVPGPQVGGEAQRGRVFLPPKFGEQFLPPRR